MIKTAKTSSRKSLETELAKARRAVLSAKADKVAAESRMRNVQTELYNANQRLENMTKIVIENTDKLRIMDLTGAKALRHRGDETNYIIDGDEYHVDSNDINDLKTIHWKEYKKQKQERTADSDAADDYNFDDDIFSIASMDDNLSELLEEEPQVFHGPKDFPVKVAELKIMKEQHYIEYLLTVAEVKDLARGLSVNGIRETEYDGWKNEHFIQLLDAVNA